MIFATSLYYIPNSIIIFARVWRKDIHMPMFSKSVVIYAVDSCCWSNTRTSEVIREKAMSVCLIIRKCKEFHEWWVVMQISICIQLAAQAITMLSWNHNFACYIFEAFFPFSFFLLRFFALSLLLLLIIKQVYWLHSHGSWWWLGSNPALGNVMWRHFRRQRRNDDGIGWFSRLRKEKCIIKRTPYGVRKWQHDLGLDWFVLIFIWRPQYESIMPFFLLSERLGGREARWRGWRVYIAQRQFGMYCTKHPPFGTFQVDLGNIAFWLWCVSLRSVLESG